MMNRLTALTLKTCLLLAGSGLLFACTSIELDTGFSPDSEIFGRIVDQTEDLFPHIDPLYISDEIRQLIDSQLSRRESEQTRVEKLQDILYSPDFLNMQYGDSKTHTALEVFHARRGNCLSVMNLYVAMARYAGVDANFQTVDVQPNWDRRGNLLVISQHINATGQFSVNRHYVVDFTPEIALQQLTSSVIDDHQARALYFNNLGVEAMIAEDFEQALVYLKNALFLDPELSISWNNIGTAYNRLSHRELAEYSYQMAFNTDARNATAINNLAKFYRGAGDMGLARQYEQAIERFNNRNPYYHYARGALALTEKDLQTARSSFRRALRLKEAEPDFYTALARVYIELGDPEAASRLRESARQLVAQNAEIYQPSDQKLRIIDNDSILRDTAPGISIIFQ